jgi:hypothetical protein
VIDYSIIADSIEYYQKNDFKRIESPWTVTKAVSDITKPPECDEFTIKEKNKVLVASGEQSFLYLYLKGFLPAGRYQTVTPCFRNDSFDSLHTKYFVKNELIRTDITSVKTLHMMIDIARGFFEKYTPVEVVITGKDTYDLVAEGIELGSYGIRECSFLKWIYGTGVAEPRLSGYLKGWANGLP